MKVQPWRAPSEHALQIGVTDEVSVAAGAPTGEGEGNEGGRERGREEEGREKERREGTVVVVVLMLGRETTGDYRQRSNCCHVS